MPDTSTIYDPPSWTDELPIDDLFPVQVPLEVDVGCGMGRFLIARAGNNPDTNFLGIDRLLARLRKIDKKVRRQELTNVRLLRLEASYSIDYLLPAECVQTFYIFFPDPWPKKRHHKRRLFTESFLTTLHNTLAPGGQVHVATDHLGYFEEAEGLFKSDDRFEQAETFEPIEEERTNFEVLFMSKNDPIGRCSFRKQ